ncbi:MAG: trypsin-like serine protease [Chloroflexi bacterium]|nr:trypsin-like serine protease [Chloroflexota bacterium]
MPRPVRRHRSFARRQTRTSKGTYTFGQRFRPSIGVPPALFAYRLNLPPAATVPAFRRPPGRRPGQRRLLRMLRIGLLAAFLALAVQSAPGAGAQTLDYPIAEGWFFTQGATDTPDPQDGFAVIDDGQARFWSAFQDNGGVAAVGYPISRRFVWDGFTTQVMQKAVFQWRPESGSTAFVNVFDDLTGRGHDAALAKLLVPETETFADEGSLNFSEIVRKRIALLEVEPQLLATYQSVPDPLLTYGLPTSRVREYEGLRSIRLQRAVLQLWTSDFPWASAGTVTVANGGDLAKQVGMFAGAPLQPERADRYVTPGTFISEPPEMPVVDVVAGARAAVVRIEGTTGSGSGFVIDPEGHILTNAHVVERVGEMEVVLEDGSRWEPELIGIDSARDIALLKVNPDSPLPFLSLATNVRAGESVVALGFPLGLQGGLTVTTGIISSLERVLDDVIHLQTDAAINPGNSGGPLLNLRGQVVGMNTSGIPSRLAQGIGFAIRHDELANRLPELLSGRLAPSTQSPPTNETTPSGASDFGPASGTLNHDPDDGFIKGVAAGFDAADFVIEATFFNPYSAAAGGFDYGFKFRDAGGNAFFLIVTSDASWRLFYGDDPPRTLVGEGRMPRFRDGVGESNHLSVIAVGESGWLFGNGELVAGLELDAVTGAGDVAAISGYYNRHQVAGAATRFESFAGRGLQPHFDSGAGMLERVDDDKIAVLQSGAFARDLVAEAEVPLPTETDWDAGFIFRNSQSDRFEMVALDGDGEVFHYTRTTGEDRFDRLGTGQAPEPVEGQVNRRLQLIATGSSGWFFVDGKLALELDLSHNLDRGFIALAGGIISGNRNLEEFDSFRVFTP